MLASPIDLFSLSESRVEVISEVAAESRDGRLALDANVAEGIRRCLLRTCVVLSGAALNVWLVDVSGSFTSLRRFNWISCSAFGSLFCGAPDDVLVDASALETFRRFDKRSAVLNEELTLVPIELCGAETFRWLRVRDTLLLEGRLWLEDGARESGAEPAESRLLKEKERRDGKVPSLSAVWESIGDDASLVEGAVASSSSRIISSSSTSTSFCLMLLRADTSVGVYLRSG